MNLSRMAALYVSCPDWNVFEVSLVSESIRHLFAYKLEGSQRKRKAFQSSVGVREGRREEERKCKTSESEDVL